MEGGGNMGPTATSHTHSYSHSHSRPVRTSSRYFYGHSSSSSSPANFSGPVRRWEKKWVHVSSSQPSNPNKPRKFFLSNGLKSPSSPLLLCKWTPLSRPQSCSGNGQISRRKFRYTPITVFEEKKKLTEKEIADKDNIEETNQSPERPAMDSDDIYGLLDMNSDLMGAHQESSGVDLIYTRRSHLNLGLNLENRYKDGLI